MNSVIRGVPRGIPQYERHFLLVVVLADSSMGLWLGGVTAILREERFVAWETSVPPTALSPDSLDHLSAPKGLSESSPLTLCMRGSCCAVPYRDELLA